MTAGNEPETRTARESVDDKLEWHYESHIVTRK